MKKEDGMARKKPKGSPQRWSEREEQILAEEYPKGGTNAVYERMLAEGFDRKRGAIRMRAHAKGIQNEEYMRRTGNDEWSAEEEEILVEFYTDYGAQRVQDELDAIGKERSLGSIRGRATTMGLHRSNTPSRRFGEKLGNTKVLNVVFDDVRDKMVLEHIATHENRSEYIRGLVEADMTPA